jgi:hypothetical protein
VYGDWIPGAVGAPVAVSGYLEQATSVEFVLNRDTTVTTWKAYLPAATVITPLSLVNFQAQVFQVDGEPWFVYNPRTKAVDHIECKLTVVAG